MNSAAANYIYFLSSSRSTSACFLGPGAVLNRRARLFPGDHQDNSNARWGWHWSRSLRDLRIIQSRKKVSIFSRKIESDTFLKATHIPSDVYQELISHDVSEKKAAMIISYRCIDDNIPIDFYFRWISTWFSMTRANPARLTTIFTSKSSVSATRRPNGRIFFPTFSSSLVRKSLYHQLPFNAEPVVPPGGFFFQSNIRPTKIFFYYSQFLRKANIYCVSHYSVFQQLFPGESKVNLTTIKCFRSFWRGANVYCG